MGKAQKKELKRIDSKPNLVNLFGRKKAIYILRCGDPLGKKFPDFFRFST